MRRLPFFVSVIITIGVACGGTSNTPAPDDDAGTGADSGAKTTDAGPSGDGSVFGFDAAPDPTDGTATRKACTNTLGNALSTFHGRLDGYLVSIVPTTEHTCNGDSTHVHLQVVMNNAAYDVAVNVDGLEANLSHAMVDGAWAEGWHTTGVGLDYPTTLGIHSTAFATTNAQSLIASLANANHISVFGTAYGPDGMHLIHRKGNGNDGGIIVNPLGATPHYFVFRFDTDTF